MQAVLLMLYGLMTFMVIGSLIAIETSDLLSAVISVAVSYTHLTLPTKA